MTLTVSPIAYLALPIAGVPKLIERNLYQAAQAWGDRLIECDAVSVAAIVIDNQAYVTDACPFVNTFNLDRGDVR
jgi:hypothetical protein